MHRDLVHGHVLCHGFDHGLHLARRADADGVAQRNLVTAHGVEFLRHLGDLGRRDIAFVGTTHHAGHVASHLDFPGQRGLGHGPEARKALGDGAVDVLLAEGFRRSTEYRHFLCAGCQCCFEAGHVRHQHRVINAGLSYQPFHDLGMIGHLRHPFGRDEGGGFNAGEAGIGQALYELQLDLGGHRIGLILQPVTGTHLNDANFFRQAHGLFSEGYGDSESINCGGGMIRGA